MPTRRFVFAAVGLAGALGVAWVVARPIQRANLVAALPDSPVKTALESPLRRVAVADPVARKIVDAAKAQIGDAYDASYQTIAYPGGDVPKGAGACTDVVVRALRGAGMDLQRLIHDDMKAHFAAYPNAWKLGHTDTNIDHRRVPNHIVFFRRYGQELPIGTATDADIQSWQPGDIVEWKLDGNKWHTGIVSDGIGPRGLPLVVHNGWQCVEQDALDAWTIKAHFRFPKR